ncbi:MAG: thioredoxin-like domain-containing protein [Dehalococcoidia bacterium]
MSTPAGGTWAGTEPAPEFPPGLTWFNVSRPLSLDDLRGKVVLLDFWTQGCINCQHIIPDLLRLEEEFGNRLVVIGVHSGKYDEEHDDQAIREAIGRYGITHPVVNDSEFRIWRSYGVRAWPTLVVIDPAGNVVGGRSGEGVYAIFKAVIAGVIEQFRGHINDEPLPLAASAVTMSTFLSFPAEVEADPARGRLYLSDAGHHRIIETTLDGRVLRAFGSGRAGFADGPAAAAAFRDPQGLALAPDGRTLFVADTRNHAIRAVDLDSGAVVTIAGTGRQLTQLPRDGAAAVETAMASPWDVLVYGERLFIAMAGVHQLWVMDLHAGTIAVFAGTAYEGVDDGHRLTEATLAQPSGLATDGTYLYWVDPEASAVRRVALDGHGPVETLVGTGLFDFGDRDGPAPDALLQHPQGIAVVDDRIYVADTFNHKIKLLASGGVATLAGAGERGWRDGPAGAAQFNEPNGMSVAGRLLYVADTNNHVIRTVDLETGDVATLALSDPGAAGPPVAGAVMRVEIAGQEVAPGAANLQILVRVPEGYQLNGLAPGRLDLSSSNSAVVGLGESSVSWSSSDDEVMLPIPVLLGEGEATVTAAGAVYYCRKGEQELCLIQQVELVIPVEVRPGAAAGELTAAYTLPVGP